jgi:hypothetical protein
MKSPAESRIRPRASTVASSCSLAVIFIFPDGLQAVPREMRCRGKRWHTPNQRCTNARPIESYDAIPRCKVKIFVNRDSSTFLQNRSIIYGSLGSVARL